MRFAPASESKRLKLLQTHDPRGNWTSCASKRRCVSCDRVFTGSDVRMSWFRRNIARLHCPTTRCSGSPISWVHPGNPLVTDEAWADWDRLIRETEFDWADEMSPQHKTG